MFSVQVGTEDVYGEPNNVRSVNRIPVRFDQGGATHIPGRHRREIERLFLWIQNFRRLVVH